MMRCGVADNLAGKDLRFSEAGKNRKVIFVF